jgi:hypothetical protein
MIGKIELTLMKMRRKRKRYLGEKEPTEGKELNNRILNYCDN